MTSAGPQHRATSTELTAGAGFTFEDTVIAYYLSALLRQGTAAGQEGTVTSVAVQQAGHGHPMDDLVVEFRHADRLRRLSLQVKRKITISAAGSNTDFRNIIDRANDTRTAPHFQPDIDRYGFVAEYAAISPLRTLRRIVEWARSSPTGDHFAARFADGGSASTAARNLRNGLSPIINANSPNGEASFFRQFAAERLDGLMEDGPLRAAIVNYLQELVVRANDGQDILLFDRLCRVARDGGGSGRKWTRTTLLQQLQGSVKLRVGSGFRTDVDRLQQHSISSMGDVSEKIDGFHVDRSAQEKKVRARLTKHRLVNISGLPGTGKSAILKRIASECSTQGPVLFLKSDRLIGADWLSFAVAIGIEHHDVSDLLFEIGNAGTPILFIDGIDRISPDQKTIISDILRTIEDSEHLSDWKVLASSRNQGLEAYRAWFPATFFHETGIGDVSIEPFSDDEAAAIAKAKPKLAMLIMGSPGVRAIARRPFFAAMIARGVVDHTAAPQTEVDLIHAWWEGGGYDAPAHAVPRRRRALLALAERGVRSLGSKIRARGLDDPTLGEVTALQVDGIIREEDGGARYSFSHDIFFEWAFFRLLIERADEWPTALTEAGEPPLLGRVVGLLAQHVLESPGKWTAGYRHLESHPLRSQWRRDWLTSPPFTSYFIQSSDEFGALLCDDDYILLEKFLVWFQAQHTIPNPLILSQRRDLEDEENRLRMADVLGWPSDIQGWGRLLDWLVPLTPRLPVRLLPNVLDLFSVWQNAPATIENARSAKILDVCSSWLKELEDTKQSPTVPRRPARWDALGREVRLQLLASLRSIILTSCRAYPAHARAIFQRAIDDERVRQEVYNEVIRFTPLMAGVAPDQVIALAKAEMMTELPQERIDREQRDRHVHKEQMKRIQAIPEKDRTEEQRRALNPLFFEVGHRGVDLEDVGIQDTLGYHPTNPLQEPFAGLFANDAESALRLVRDLANHATRGWRQVYHINQSRMGTPIPVVLEFPWGKQTFWGDWTVYSWFKGQQAPKPLESAFLSLSHWAFKQIDAGQSTDEVIRLVVEGNECYAVVGLALVLALETLHVSETTLPLVSCQRLWEHDTKRLVQETSLAGLWGLATMSLSRAQMDAKKFLDTRTSCKRGVRELAMRFRISSNHSLCTRFQDALTRFPEELPYEVEEKRTIPEVTQALQEKAITNAGFGDISNYYQEPSESGQRLVGYQSPALKTPDGMEEFLDTSKYLHKSMITQSAMGSLETGQPSDKLRIDEAISLARSCDHELMFERRHEVPSHTDQSMIAALAAYVIRFANHSIEVRNWALSVLERVENMSEIAGVFWAEKNPWHPTVFAVHILKDLRKETPSDLQSVRRLMRLTLYPLKEISNLAFLALFEDPDAWVSWTAMQLALELATLYRPRINKDGSRDDRVNETARKKSLRRALRTLTTDGVPRPIKLPEAWIKVDEQDRPLERLRDDSGLIEPDPCFDASGVAEIFQHLPIESWCESEAIRQKVATALQDFVAWTSERLMLSSRAQGRRRDRSVIDLMPWMGCLGGLLGRAAPHFEIEMVRNVMLAPFLCDDDDALSVVGAFARSTVARHVFDAETIPSSVFGLLEICVDHVVSNPTLTSAKDGPTDVYGTELGRLIEALMFVSIENAERAARFVNGDWSQIGIIMPLVSRLVNSTGSSAFVMGVFLRLCERVGAAYPLDSFVEQADAVLCSVVSGKGNWAGTTLPARTAAVVQLLAEAHFPLQVDQACGLLRVLDALIDLGDRRSVALEQSEVFRGIQVF